MSFVTVVGAGLAGSECAWQLAERGVRVRLLEQKPQKKPAAHVTMDFAELVCSNSFRGAALTNAVGLLKEEMRRAGSLIMRIADQTRVPAGGALAVDRELFSAGVSKALRSHPSIEIKSEEVRAVPSERPTVLATGPLTGDALAADLARIVGSKHLAYYDAIAPIVNAESIDWSRVFRASRYDKGGDGAYINCPLSKDEYFKFVETIKDAEKVAESEFEQVRYFEGCLPVETMAERGDMTLAFGCMKPVGLIDPTTQRQPFAVVQLRAENDPPTAYNMVGFQTRMTWPEQKRVFTMIPGLEHAEFERLGCVHRNTFVNSPEILDGSLSLHAAPGVYIAGQLSGVEGYLESAAAGLVIGRHLAAKMRDVHETFPPSETALGALISHLRKPNSNFQPSNVLWSMFPALTPPIRAKKVRQQAMAERALHSLDSWLASAQN